MSRRSERQQAHFLGLDIGSLSAQAALVGDGGQLVAAASIRVKPDPLASARAVRDEALRRGGIDRDAVINTVATGYGRQTLVKRGLAQTHLSEISCHALGAWWQARDVRTVVDIGGQDAKAIRVGPDGRLQDFVMNDKCASGTGRFLEAMARTLGLRLDELGTVALQAKQVIPLSDRCSIFCETELLNALQQGFRADELAAGVCRAMATRAAALLRRVDPIPAVVMTGGVAKNRAVVEELQRLTGARLSPCPGDPQAAGAMGAAIHAMQVTTKK